MEPQTVPSALSPEDATRREFIGILGSATLAAAFFAACGSDDDSNGEDATVTIDDYFGPVTIPADPKRIIAGEGITLGNMLSIGKRPVAAAVNLNSLPFYLADQMEGIEDVTAAEGGVDIEKALALNPDLFITFAGFPDDPWNKENYDRYKAACPTLATPTATRTSSRSRRTSPRSRARSARTTRRRRASRNTRTASRN